MYKAIQYIVFFMSLAMVTYLVNSTEICFDGMNISIYQKFVIIFGYTTLLFWIVFLIMDFIKYLFIKNE